MTVGEYPAGEDAVFDQGVFHFGETVLFRCGSTVTFCRTPCHVKISRSFASYRGVSDSESGLNLGPVPEFWENGGCSVTGFGRLQTPKKGGFQG